MNLLFSIIIPTYNRAHFLSKAIESVVTQTYLNWELIIVDDGSTDNTKQLVESYINRDNRIKYFYQTNQERSTARNNGIDKAKGEYICFLDSDDIYLPKHLDVFFNLIANTSYNFYYSLKVGEIKNDFKNKFDEIICSTIHSQQVCIQKNVLLKFKYNPKLYIGEDLELWLRIAKENDLKCTNTGTVNIINHDERTINLKILDVSKQNLELILRLTNTYKTEISARVKAKIKSNAYFNVAKFYIYKLKNKLALYYLFISIINNFFGKQTNHKVLLMLAIIHLYPKKILNEYLK